MPAHEQIEAPAQEQTEVPALEQTEAPAQEQTEVPAQEQTEAPAPKKVETRGRKKKNINEIKTELKNAPSEAAKNNAIVEEAKDEMSELVNGYMLLIILDFAAPFLFCFAFKFIDKRAEKIDISKIQLTDNEIKKLSPLADVVAKQLLKDFSPITLFFLSYVSITGIKFYSELSKIKK